MILPALDLGAPLAEAFGEGTAVAAAARLPGGASRETWAVDAIDPGGTRHPLILRLDSPGATLDASNGLGREAALMRAAAASGVPVPVVIAAGRGGAKANTTGQEAAGHHMAGQGMTGQGTTGRGGQGTTGRQGIGPGADAHSMAGAPPAGLAGSQEKAIAGGVPYVLMERVEGETIPRKILRDDAYAGARPRLAAQCGQILAAVHRMPVEVLADEAAPGGAGADPLRVWRDLLDATGQPHPVFELAFRRLEGSRPVGGPMAVVHGDFRNGNLIVGPEGIRAVLDWELAHLGDPMEDLGWLCVKAWRFGSALPVGGFGGYDDLVAAYEKASGAVVDRAALRWWETFGVLKWGVICVMQTLRHLSGGTRSVELAAIGRRVCENEWDLLQML